MKSSRLFAKADRVFRLSLVLSLVCACGAGLALVGGEMTPPAATASVGPTFAFWMPHESHTGGAQFDPRLERPVEFWRAGLSLKEVFAGVAEQTGVEIRFWPPGDENERVRVNLYLNPEQPPSLRELMAQLMWVTGCGFAYEEPGEGTELRTYYLLSTSAASGAERRREERQQTALAALREEWRARIPTREEIAGKLAEYERALLLSDAELLAHYEGIDAHVLVAMLDPARRASARFVLGLGDEARQALLDGEWLTLEWRELTAEQQADLDYCLRRPAWRGGGRGGRRGAAGASPRVGGWDDRQVAQVRVGGLNFGRVMVSGQLEPAEAEPGRRRDGFVVAPELTLTGEGELTPDEAIALRRALGETISEEQARALFNEWAQARRDEGREQWDQRTREAAEARVAAQRPLSPAVEETLSSFTLPLDSSTPYALWQIQEAVASASGMHVVSDCFSQPGRSLSGPLQLLHPEGEAEMTGLLALRLSCLSTEDVSRFGWGVANDYGAGWEWHDAGSFLRFRSAARDLWRASMLSPTALGYLDEWLDPYVEEAVRSKAAATTVNMTLDLEAISLIATGLTDLQLRRGGDLVCGDPSEKAPAYRQTLRANALGAMSGTADTLRLLATLGESQWEQVRGTGLRVTYDLTPEQKVALGISGQRDEGGMARGAMPFGRPGRLGPQLGRAGRGQLGRGGPRASDAEERTGMVIRLTEEPPSGRRRGPMGRRGPRGLQVQESYYLGFWSEDEVREVYPIPRTLTVTLALPHPIVWPEGKADD